jgi:hypothetical protein
MDDENEMLTAEELQKWLKVSRNFTYTRLRYLATRVATGPTGRALLRWRRGDVLEFLREKRRAA